MASTPVRRKRRATAGIVVLAIGFVLFFVGPIVAIFVLPFWAAVIPVFVAFVMMAAGGAVWASSSASQPSAARLAKASGTGGAATVAVTCPNCGAAPASFVPGQVVTCSYCGTPFMVA